MVSDSNQSLSKRKGRQVRTSIKGAAYNRNDAVRNGNAFKRGTFSECPLSNAEDSIRDSNINQVAVILEGVIPDIRHAGFNDNFLDSGAVLVPRRVFLVGIIRHSPLTADNECAVAVLAPCQAVVFPELALTHERSARYPLLHGQRARAVLLIPSGVAPVNRRAAQFRFDLFGRQGGGLVQKQRGGGGYVGRGHGRAAPTGVLLPRNATANAHAGRGNVHSVPKIGE